MVAPNFKEYIINKTVNEYVTDLEAYVSENSWDKNKVVDFLSILAKTGCYIKYEKYFNAIGENSGNNLVYRLHGKYLLFIKRDFSLATNYLRRALLLNDEEPAWVKYYLGVCENYYEKVVDGVLYTAIPKNGSTSIKSYFHKKKAGKDVVNPHEVYGNPYFKFPRFSQEEKKQSKKVLILRDPLSRFKSYFAKNIVEANSLKEELYFTDKKTVYSLSLTPTYSEFVENFWKYVFCFNDVLHHLLPQKAYSPVLSEYDFITDMAGIDGLIDFIDGGVQRSAGSEKLPRKMVGSKAKGDSVVTTAYDQFISSIYADDYLLFKRMSAGNCVPSFIPDSRDYLAELGRLEKRLGDVRQTSHFLVSLINDVYSPIFSHIIPTKDCLDRFIERKDAGNAGSLIRLGDGEGLFLGFPEIVSRKDIDDIAYIHFGKKLKDDQILDIKSKIIKAINKSDFICIPSRRRSVLTNPETRIQRGIFSVYSYLLRNVDSYKNKVISSANIHIDLYRSERLSELLANQRKISLVSCRPELVDVLRHNYSVREVDLYQIPSEYKFGGVEVTEEHYPKRFYEVLDELRVNPGELFLVAAGVLGKYYAAVVAEKGGVAFDIGSVADALVGVSSRPYISKKED